MKGWRSRGLRGRSEQSRNFSGNTTGAASPKKKPTDNKHMKKELLFVGLDVHAKTITSAVAPGDGGEARPYGTITHDLQEDSR